jgi:hypothetical protein
MGRHRFPDRSPHDFRLLAVSPSPGSIGNHRPRSSASAPHHQPQGHHSKMGCNRSRKQLPQFVLFGDSLTEWSFDSSTQGFGWYLTDSYKGKAEMVNEGTASIYCFTFLHKQTVTTR